MKKRGLDNSIDSKGQVTLFIIAGIVILLLAGSIFYINSLKQEQIPVIPAIKDVPAEILPVREYVEFCLDSLSREALVKLGMRGGYINPADFGIQTSLINPTESQGIIFAPGSEVQIPYWRYMASPNTRRESILFSSLSPGLKRGQGVYKMSSIEEQLDKYLLDNMPGCLDNFVPLTEQGFSFEEKGDMNMLSLVTDTDVSVYLEYPVEVTRESAATLVDQYFVSVPINLKKIYELAQDITETEDNSSFIEGSAMEWIHAYGGTSSNNLPPVYDITFENSAGTIWTKTKVHDMVDEMLMTYIPTFQVPNTANYARRIFPDDDIKQALYDSTTVPVSNFEGKYDDLEVRFDYLGWWDTYFDAGEAGVIKPDSYNVPIIPLPIGFQRYYTSYDVSFPIIVTIYDPSALNYQGYTFMFALEANLRNNEPMNETYGGYEGYRTSAGPLFCEQNQYNSGDIIMKVIDGATGKGAEGVIVEYSVAGEGCFIGETGANGSLIAKFPIATNGIVTYSKIDYAPFSEYLTTELGKETTLADATLYPYVDKNIKIKKYKMINNVLSQTPMALPDNEHAFVQLTRVKETPGSVDLLAAADFWANTSSFLHLVPGKYEGSIDLITTGPPYPIVNIPAREVDGGLFGEDYTLPAVVIPEKPGDPTDYPSGGAVFNPSTGYFTITPEMLYGSADEKLVLYVIQPKFPPTVIEDLDEMSRIEEYSTRYYSLLQPRLER